MSNNSSQGRLIKGKYLAAIEKFFNDPKNYSSSMGCTFDEPFHELCSLIAPLFKDVMTLTDVRDVMFESLREYFLPSTYGFEGLSVRQLPPAKNVIDEVVDQLSRYPRNYTCHIKLPNFCMSGMDGTSIFLAEDMEIQFPGVDEHHAILLIKGVGYYGRYAKSPFSENMIKMAKVFLFLIQRFDAPDYLGFGDTASAFVSEDDGSRSVKLELPTGLKHLLGAISLVMPKLRKATGSKFVNQHDFVSEIKETLKSGFEVFVKLTDEANSRIVAAIEWYEDSLTVENQTVAVLSVCIGLEAILGEESDMSEMTKRLCDRLAFTLGKSRTERTEYHGEYLALLKLRGKLVHAKIFRLDESDQLVLRRGTELLREVIHHEVDHLI